MSPRPPAATPPTPAAEYRLDQFLVQAGERLYRDLVERHVRRSSTSELMRESLGESRTLPPGPRAKTEAFIDHVNARIGYDAQFWATGTCADAAEAVLSAVADTFGQETATALAGDQYGALGFTWFQLATLSFAYSASTQRAQRKFMGIRKSWLFR